MDRCNKTLFAMTTTTMPMTMILRPIATHLRRPQHPNDKTHFNRHQEHHRRPLAAAFCSLRRPIRPLFCSASDDVSLQQLLHQFDPKIPIEEAVTPPSSWYTDPSFFDLELHRLFYRGWQAVGSPVASLFAYIFRF
jgi:hypothetical protein